MPISNFSFTRFNPDIKQLIRQGPVLPIQVLVPTALGKLLRAQGQQVPPPVSGFAPVNLKAYAVMGKNLIALVLSLIHI